MPISRRATTDEDVTECLRPYTFHGLDLTVVDRHGVGDCPFCGKENKFTVSVDVGLWRCLVCGIGSEKGGGNALTFIRLMHEWSVKASPNLHDIAEDRLLLSPDTLVAWGVCKLFLDRQTWLVPGYNADGKLYQLYRRLYIDGKWLLLPTPGVWPAGTAHALHLPARDFDLTRPKIDVMEGPWDGMAMWEVAQAENLNVVAVPGCNVWQDSWSELCRGKNVTLWYDSDHPAPEALKQGRTMRAGLDGMCRVAKRLSGIVASVRFVRWGVDGYDAAKPSGWDVRDHLSSASNRPAALLDLITKVELAPTEDRKSVV